MNQWKSFHNYGNIYMKIKKSQLESMILEEYNLFNEKKGNFQELREDNSFTDPLPGGGSDFKKPQQVKTVPMRPDDK